MTMECSAQIRVDGVRLTCVDQGDHDFHRASYRPESNVQPSGIDGIRYALEAIVYWEAQPSDNRTTCASAVELTS